LVAVLVVGWGTWLSVGSSRHGPAWAQAVLESWRWMPWAVGGAGALLAVLAQPRWVGVAIAYIALVTGWLARSVRGRLDYVRHAYGFDAPTATTVAQASRAGNYLLAGALALAAIGLWDMTVRGWDGVFGLILAGFLVAAGLLLRGRS
jgi:hypothetical protein